MAAISSNPLAKFEMHPQLLREIQRGTWSDEEGSQLRFGLPRGIVCKIGEYCDNIDEDSKVRALAFRAIKGSEMHIIVGANHLATRAIADVLSDIYEPLVESVNEVFVEIDTRDFPTYTFDRSQRQAALQRAFFNIPPEEFAAKAKAVLAAIKEANQEGPIEFDDETLSTPEGLAYLASSIVTGMNHFQLLLEWEGISGSFGYEEAALQPVAAMKGKEVSSLEKPEDQIEIQVFLDEIRVKNYFRDLPSALIAHARMKDIVCSMSERAARGDLAKLTEMLFPPTSSEGEINARKKLFFDRNPFMVASFLQKRSDKSLAAVGAGHLPDDPMNPQNKGMLTLFKEAGYRIEPL